MDRIWKTFSEQSTGDKEIKKTKNILIKNGYSEFVVDREKKSFITLAKRTSNTARVDNDDQQHQKEDGKMTIYILSFVSNNVENFA
jgi:hypothetical protein